jgi:hypothetical protein
MRALSAVLLAVFSISALADDRFPSGPNPDLTPGSLCTQSQQKRYPEKITYCSRAVGSALKKDIINTYDATFGYQIGQMERSLFKIDHYIPLCMGGSNDVTNLWPQHASVYFFTDPLEQIACQKMADGRLLQKRAVEMIKEAKNNLERASQILEEIKSL